MLGDGQSNKHGTDGDAESLARADQASGTEEPAAQAEDMPQVEPREPSAQAEDIPQVEPQEPPSLEELVADLQAQLVFEQERALRATADLQNYRRRTQEDYARRMKYACADLLTDLIPVLDHFGMAVAASDVNEHTRMVCKGYEMILQQLTDLAQRYGMEQIEAVEGMFFDPEYHEAVERVQTIDPCEGTVVSIVRNGYKLHERVLRPVQVAVAVAPAEEDEQ